MVAALLLHLLLPFFAAYQIPAAAQAQMTSPFGDKILLCTAEGFRWVKWEDLQSGKEKPQPHKQYRCPLCYTAAQGQGINPVPEGLVLRDVSLFTNVAHKTEIIFSRQIYWQKLRSRSPPALA